MPLLNREFCSGLGSSLSNAHTPGCGPAAVKSCSFPGVVFRGNARFSFKLAFLLPQDRGMVIVTPPGRLYLHRPWRNRNENISLTGIYFLRFHLSCHRLMRGAG